MSQDIFLLVGRKKKLRYFSQSVKDSGCTRMPYIHFRFHFHKKMFCIFSVAQYILNFLKYQVNHDLVTVQGTLTPLLCQRNCMSNLKRIFLLLQKRRVLCRIRFSLLIFFGTFFGNQITIFSFGKVILFFLPLFTSYRKKIFFSIFSNQVYLLLSLVVERR